MTIDLDVHAPAIMLGDADAFGRWMAGSERVVRESLRSFAAVVDVEAILQESLLRVWQVAPRFTRDGKPNGLLRFAIRIARNLAVSELRRTKTEPTDELEISDEPRVPDPLLREAIRECRDKLPPKPRQVFDSRLADAGAHDDYDLAEAAGMRVNTFLQNFTRARQLLADCLKKKGIEV